MRRLPLSHLLFCALFVSFCWISSGLPAAEPDFHFKDAGDEAGLFPGLMNIAGHGAGWGDIDGDGWADLYVGTFGGKSYNSKPNQLFQTQYLSTS